MRLCAIMAIVAWASVARAQQPAWIQSLEQRLDAEIPALLEEGDIPGAVILVGHRQNGAWVTSCRAYGQLQRQPDPAPMPQDALFDLASLTKPMATGTAMMILADRGLLSVDDSVLTHLAEYDTESKAGIQVRDLMTHCSGLQAYMGPASREQVIRGHGYPAPDPLVSCILNIGLRHSPARTVSVYSCLNAITCAQIIERVSGQSLDGFTRENIWEPLGMADTDFSPGPGPRVVPTTASERSSGEFLRGMVHDPLAHVQGGVSGNAGLFSTAQDLSIFAQMMLQGGERNGVRVLSRESVARMTSDQMPEGVTTRTGGEIHRGLLWQVYLPEPGDVGLETIPSYGHTGYTGTALRLWPSEDLYVIALTNRVHPDDTGLVTGLRHRCWIMAGEAVLGIDESTVILKDAGPLLRHRGG
jgi:CubicO group peptidase (beta-lactamase class C family)